MPVHNQKIALSVLGDHKISLSVKREDLSHPTISGNKFRKLKYNLIEAKERGYRTLLTFGGAFSNHIAAVACAAREFGFNSIGLIRGEEIEKGFMENPTLALADAQGMKFKFVPRSVYRRKNENDFLDDLKQEFGRFYLLPEGGTNDLAVRGL